MLEDLPQSINFMAEYKSCVENVLPWHDKIYAMSKEFKSFCTKAMSAFPEHFFAHYKDFGTLAIHEDVVCAYLYYLRCKNGPAHTTNVRKLTTIRNLLWQTKAGIRMALAAEECPSLYRARADMGTKVARLFAKWAREDLATTPVRAFLLEEHVERFSMEAIWYHMEVAWDSDLANLWHPWEKLNNLKVRGRRKAVGWGGGGCRGML